MYKYCCQIHSYDVKYDLGDHLVDIRSANILNTTTSKMSVILYRKTALLPYCYPYVLCFTFKKLPHKLSLNL